MELRHQDFFYSLCISRCDLFPTDILVCLYIALAEPYTSISRLPLLLCFKVMLTSDGVHCIVLSSSKNYIVSRRADSVVSEDDSTTHTVSV